MNKTEETVNRPNSSVKAQAHMLKLLSCYIACYNILYDMSLGSYHITAPSFRLSSHTDQAMQERKLPNSTAIPKGITVPQLLAIPKSTSIPP